MTPDKMIPHTIWLPALLLSWTILASTQQSKPRPIYLLTQDEINAVPKAQSIREVIELTRPCWFAFNRPARSSDLRPPNPCTFSLDYRVIRSTCGFRGYLDDDLEFRVLNSTSPRDVGEVRLYPPRTEWVIGDSVVHTGDCPVFHVVRIGSWAELRNNRAAVLTSLEKGDTPIPMRDVPVALRPFGFSWDLEGSNRLLFRDPQRPACGSIDLPTIATTDTLSGVQRRALLALLHCAAAT